MRNYRKFDVKVIYNRFHYNTTIQFGINSVIQFVIQFTFDIAVLTLPHSLPPLLSSFLPNPHSISTLTPPPPALYSHTHSTPTSTLPALTLPPPTLFPHSLLTYTLATLAPPPPTLFPHSLLPHPHSPLTHSSSSPALLPHSLLPHLHSCHTHSSPTCTLATLAPPPPSFSTHSLLLTCTLATLTPPLPALLPHSLLPHLHSCHTRSSPLHFPPLTHDSAPCLETVSV